MVALKFIDRFRSLKKSKTRELKNKHKSSLKALSNIKEM